MMRPPRSSPLFPTPPLSQFIFFPAPRLTRPTKSRCARRGRRFSDPRRSAMRAAAGGRRRPVLPGAAIQGATRWSFSASEPRGDASVPERAVEPERTAGTRIHLAVDKAARGLVDPEAIGVGDGVVGVGDLF